jgi:hypothetical protein
MKNQRPDTEKALKRNIGRNFIDSQITTTLTPPHERAYSKRLNKKIQDVETISMAKTPRPTARAPIREKSETMTPITIDV